MPFSVAAKEETAKNIYIQSNFTLLNNSYSIIKNERNDKYDRK